MRWIRNGTFVWYKQNVWISKKEKETVAENKTGGLGTHFGKRLKRKISRWNLQKKTTRETNRWSQRDSFLWIDESAYRLGSSIIEYMPGVKWMKKHVNICFETKQKPMWNMDRVRTQPRRHNQNHEWSTRPPDCINERNGTSKYPRVRENTHTHETKMRFNLKI